MAVHGMHREASIEINASPESVYDLVSTLPRMGDCRGDCRMIANDQQFQLAQAGVKNLQRVLLAARKVHSPHAYRLMAAPILLELQQREQEILAYLSQTEPEAVQSSAPTA